MSQPFRYNQCGDSISQYSDRNLSKHVSKTKTGGSTGAYQTNQSGTQSSKY